jgi:hypothetical protein
MIDMFYFVFHSILILLWEVVQDSIKLDINKSLLIKFLFVIRSKNHLSFLFEAVGSAAKDWAFSAFSFFYWGGLSFVSFFAEVMHGLILRAKQHGSLSMALFVCHINHKLVWSGLVFLDLPEWKRTYVTSIHLSCYLFLPFPPPCF